MGCGSSAQGTKYAGQEQQAGAPAPTPEAAAKSGEAAKAAPAAKLRAKKVSFCETSPEEEKEEDDEDEMEMDEEEFEKQVAARTQQEANSGPRKTRCAVSSEAAHRDAGWEAPVFEKTAEQEQRLTKALGASFIFAAISAENLPVVIKAFQELSVAKGTTVITQGEEVVSDQPALYVFESGKLSTYKKAQAGVVFEYNTPGQYFGDLALLYNAPRAATVVADEDCKLWSIDRTSFNYLVKDAARTARTLRMAFLEEVPILKGLTPEEKATLTDVMNIKFVMKDEVVIKQGDVGSDFFILESGKLEARKDGAVVLTYSPKDYFGELSLLRHAPRAADVVATETSKVLSLDSGSFRRIVGSLEQVMKERAASYEGVSIPS